MKTTHVVALSCALIASAALADKLHLKSGSMLTGKAGAASTGELVFVSDDLGEVKVKLENIVKLEDAGSHVVLYSDNTTETKGLAIADGAWTADAKPLDMGNVKEIDPEEETWHGSVNGAFNAARGNTVENSWSVLANVNRRWEKDRFNATFGYYYSEKGTADTDKERSTDRWEAEAQHDHFWLTKVYTYENLRYDRDMIQALQARYRVGLGAGYQWLENDDFGFGKVSFNQEVGMSYVGEKFEHVDDDNYGAFRYAHHLAWEIAAVKNLSFAHNLEWLPQVDEWADNYIIDADAGIVYKFSANWQLVAKVEWDYKSKVGPGAKHSDLRYILGLGYTW